MLIFFRLFDLLLFLKMMNFLLLCFGIFEIFEFWKKFLVVIIKVFFLFYGVSRMLIFFCYVVKIIEYCVGIFRLVRLLVNFLLVMIGFFRFFGVLEILIYLLWFYLMVILVFIFCK